MIETLFHSPGTNFPMMALLTFCALAALFAMVLIAWRDVRTFEIDFALLGVATVAFSGVIVAGTGPAGLAVALLAGLGAGIVTWLAVLWKPGRIGQGDIWLMGFITFAAGPDHVLPVMMTLGLCAVATSAFYSIARGKRLFRSMFPAALPGMGAATLALVLRLGDIRPQSAGLAGFPAGFDSQTLALLVVGGALTCGVVTVGLTRIIRRIRS